MCTGHQPAGPRRLPPDRYPSLPSFSAERRARGTSDPALLLGSEMTDDLLATSALADGAFESHGSRSRLPRRRALLLVWLPHKWPASGVGLAVRANRLL